MRTLASAVVTMAQQTATAVSLVQLLPLLSQSAQLLRPFLLLTANASMESMVLRFATAPNQRVLLRHISTICLLPAATASV